MVKSYVLWALVACVTYSFVPPLVRVATREIPGAPAAFISNLVLVLAILVVILVSGYEVVTHMRSGASLSDLSLTPPPKTFDLQAKSLVHTIVSTCVTPTDHTGRSRYGSILIAVSQCRIDRTFSFA